ncbi:MAG: ABC transporter [Ilumatobacter sp.]
MLELVDPLSLLRDALDGITFSLPLDASAAADEVRSELSDQLSDYVIPRLSSIDAPLLVVLGGSTGSGKSTITNSIVGANVSLAGVLRPSTRTPVLVCRTDDRAWFATGGVLPTLPRSTGERPTGSSLHLLTSDALPAGLALLDAPDIDSVEIANHELAAQLLGAADAWLFVTTASRYADAVPWEYLRRARDRSVALAIVVNRVPVGAADEVVDHLRSMLRENGLADVTIMSVTERAADEGLDDGRLTDSDIAGVRSWLDGLVRGDRGAEVVLGTLSGALDSVPDRADAVALALDAQGAAIGALRRISHDEYQTALADLDEELGSGTLLRGEVLDRWREHVGTSAVMERLQQGVGRIRDRIRSMITRRPVDVEATKDQLGTNLETLVRNHADRAALSTVEHWERTAGGSTVLADADRGLDRPTATLSARLDRELGDWQDGVLQLVQDQAGNKLALARFVSIGLNGVSVAVMIAVFSQTGGLTGAEAGVAAGTAAVTQTLLTAIFGDSALRELVQTARDDLRLRLAGVFEVERARFDTLLATHSAEDERAVLESAIHAVRTARRS